MAAGSICPPGPLRGKTTLAVVVWLVAWATPYVWHKKNVDFPQVFPIAVGLITLGATNPFPWFFELFAGGPPISQSSISP